jgi:hypothetical protein
MKNKPTPFLLADNHTLSRWDSNSCYNSDSPQSLQLLVQQIESFHKATDNATYVKDLMDKNGGAGVGGEASIFKEHFF